MSNFSQNDTDKRLEIASVNAESIPSGKISRKKTLRFNIKGWSMYPFIKPGDILEVQAVNAGELQEGDIALFRIASGNFVVHRFINMTKANLLLTNGDSLRGFDELVQKEQIFAKVIRIEHNGWSLKLEGKLNNIIRWLIIKLARNRIPLQITLKQNMGRIHWLLGKRHIV
jgi:signal peptidase I